MTALDTLFRIGSMMSNLAVVVAVTVMVIRDIKARRRKPLKTYVVMDPCLRQDFAIFTVQVCRPGSDRAEIYQISTDKIAPILPDQVLDENPEVRLQVATIWNSHLP